MAQRSRSVARGRFWRAASRYTSDAPAVTVSTTRSTSRCPLCSEPSSSLHSRYNRTLRDVPCGGRQVQLILTVRKFFCRNPLCPRKIFTERIPQFVEPWARMTTRLCQVVQAIGLATCGNGGARLAAQLGISTSRHTILRRIMDLPDVSPGSVVYLGIDDFKNLTEAVQVLLARCQAEILAACETELLDQDQQSKPVISIAEWRPKEPAHVEKVRLARRAGRTAFCQASPALARAYPLIQDFRGMLHRREGDRLDAWLAKVTESDLAELQSFVSGIEKDKAAVQAGLTWSVNNGMVEEFVTKVKLIKRQMYGKAGFALLRQRVLHAL